MIDYSLILCKKYSGKAWSVGDTYESLQWFDSSSKPTQAELDSHWESVQAEIAANAYKAKRAKEYPPIGDQLDALFHAGVFPPEMAALIQAVKDKYPKEQS